MELAKKLNLNQVRVFVPNTVYTEDKDNLPAKLKLFVRECDKREIGVIPVVGSGPWLRDTTQREPGVEWAQFLIESISGEHGLVMWDVMNEPDWATSPPEKVQREFENAKFMANTFHELDPNIPVTIGLAFVDGMIELAGYVDVLQFHDYKQTKEQIRNNIARAEEFAAKVDKPLINGELRCIACANPYDITLQEHMNANVGWYILELMIVREGWGTVHGVFYEDESVRDPSIVAAIMGHFRKCTPDILPAEPYSENWISKIVDQGNQWQKKPEPENSASTEQDIQRMSADSKILPVWKNTTEQFCSLKANKFLKTIRMDKIKFKNNQVTSFRWREDF